MLLNVLISKGGGGGESDCHVNDVLSHIPEQMLQNRLNIEW